MQEITFTDDAVHALPFSTNGRFEIFSDPDIEGLRLVVLDRRKIFVHLPRFRDPRIHLKISIGAFPEIRTKAAKTYARRVNAIVRRTMEGFVKEVEAHAAAPGEAPTFADVVGSFVEAMPARRHNKRAASDQKFVRRHILDPDVNFLLQRQIADITKADVRRLIEAIWRSRGRRTAETCLVKIRTMFNWATQERHRTFVLVNNPCAGLAAARCDPALRSALRGRTGTSLPHGAATDRRGARTTGHDTPMLPQS